MFSCSGPSRIEGVQRREGLSVCLSARGCLFESVSLYVPPSPGRGRPGEGWLYVPPSPGPSRIEGVLGRGDQCVSLCACLPVC